MTSFMYYFFDAFWSIKANSERSELNYDSFFANLNPGVNINWSCLKCPVSVLVAMQRIFHIFWKYN